MPEFNPLIVTTSNQVDHLTRAYAAAGVTMPSGSKPFADLVHSAPTAVDVATQIARETFDEGADPAELYETAVTRMQRAMAADALRTAYSQVASHVARENLPNVLERAATDLNPAVANSAKALKNAADKLRPGNPLSVDAAIEDDTTKEYKIAVKELHQLAVFAGLYEVRVGGVVPANGISKLISILNLPECNVERVTPAGLGASETVNPNEITGTLAVRKLDHDIRKDVDTALLGVARGDYEGVTFSLATPDEYRERWNKLQAAFTQRTDRGSNTIYRSSTSTWR